MKLIDRQQRHLNYLRVSITDRCNLRCQYCKPQGVVSKLAHTEILSYEEILRIIRVGVSLGISKVRVTGGEPLVRKDAVDLLREIVAMPGVRDVSLTTNGVLLADHVQQIRNAGVKRLNVSLDSLRPERFRQITGFDQFHRVWNGILAAHEAGFSPIKINVVTLKGINDDEVADLARLSMIYPFHIRFIEYMPIGASGLDRGLTLATEETHAIISRIGPLEAIGRDRNDGPAARFKIKDATGEVGFISAMSHHFCESCNRLRLTAAGQLRVCLLSDRQVDFKTALREGCSDEDLGRLFLQAVALKPSRHHISEPLPEVVNGQMSAIGG